MLDQLLQILSPQKNHHHHSNSNHQDCNRTTSGNTGVQSGGSGSKKHRSWIKKGKKNEKKPIIEEKKAYLEESFLKTRPNGIDLISLIDKPEHVDIKEWIATHTISLFHNINLIYGTISEYCTAETCPLMQGPCQTQYVWVEERGKKLKCTAAQYIDYVMTFCQKSISNQELFPTKYAHEFQENFWLEMKKMHRFMFNVLAHLYYAHSALIQQMDLNFHLNTIFQHFIILSRHYQLVEIRELSCLDDLSLAMGLAPTTSISSSSTADVIGGGGDVSTRKGNGGGWTSSSSSTST